MPPDFRLFRFELLAACFYLLIGRWLLASAERRRRHAVFAALNIAAVYCLFFYGRSERFAALFNLLFAAYVLLIAVQWVVLRLTSNRAGWTQWLAFFMPIALLLVIRYAPAAAIARAFSSGAYAVMQRHPEFTPAWIFVGFSYMAFRTSYLVIEVRNGLTPMPSLTEYLGFAFFAPTMSVGPINRYAQYRIGIEKPLAQTIPVGRALMRVLIGAVKFRFLSPLLNQLTYTGLLLDGHPHPWIDLPIASVAYYLYLYCNFSGFCDMAIGGAGLMGISVAENFIHPFRSRNMADFYNRWHITLSHYMRDVVFSPMSKRLVYAFGPRYASHGIALTILVVFLLIGVWHGTGWNYAAYGVAHGVGVATNFYLDVYLKKRLGKHRFAAFNRNRFVHGASVSLTFCYVAASMFLFANDGAAMGKILAALRW